MATNCANRKPWGLTSGVVASTGAYQRMARVQGASQREQRDVQDGWVMRVCRLHVADSCLTDPLLIYFYPGPFRRALDACRRASPQHLLNDIS